MLRRTGAGDKSVKSVLKKGEWVYGGKAFEKNRNQAESRRAKD